MCFSMLEFSFSSDDSELAAHAADDCAPSAGYCNVICGPSVYSCAAPSFMMTLITSANARTPEECTHSDSQGSTFYPSRLYRQQEGVPTRARIRRKTQASARSEYPRAVSVSTKFSTVCFSTCWRRIHTGFKNSSWKSTCSSASNLPKSLGIINSFRSPTEYMSPYCTNIILVRIDLFFRWETNTKSRYWMKDSTTKRKWIANLELARRADQLSRAHSQET